uniref:Uncharacterized protein n=1 Tax=Spongospora subterranea TaxID=70186 RepID=A0A0H5RE35_9EUKA|eukprot:CRZ11797.1 hypothetical protein [Spongospora subterranea]
MKPRINFLVWDHFSIGFCQSNFDSIAPESHGNRESVVKPFDKDWAKLNTTIPFFLPFLQIFQSVCFFLGQFFISSSTNENRSMNDRVVGDSVLQRIILNWQPRTDKGTEFSTAFQRSRMQSITQYLIGMGNIVH